VQVATVHYLGVTYTYTHTPVLVTTQPKLAMRPPFSGWAIAEGNKISLQFWQWGKQPYLCSWMDLQWSRYIILRQYLGIIEALWIRSVTAQWHTASICNAAKLLSVTKTKGLSHTTHGNPNSPRQRSSGQSPCILSQLVDFFYIALVLSDSVPFLN